jgi:hypothetical protein
MMKPLTRQYQAGGKDGRLFAAILGGWLVLVLLILTPVFQAWGIAWWIDAIGITLVVVTLGAFALGGSIFLAQSTLKLEVDSAGLRLKNWRKSRHLPWSAVTAWCAVELDEGARLICLKSGSAEEPVAIDPDLLDGRQFARIYRDIEEHCGPPCPGAEVLGDNEGEPFKDKSP